MVLEQRVCSILSLQLVLQELRIYISKNRKYGIGIWISTSRGYTSLEVDKLNFGSFFHAIDLVF